VDLIRVQIEELVLDGCAVTTPDLSANVALELVQTLREHGVSTQYVVSMAQAVGAEVARSVRS
jgi:hypothetical protein